MSDTLLTTESAQGNTEADLGKKTNVDPSSEETPQSTGEEVGKQITKSEVELTLSEDSFVSEDQANAIKEFAKENGLSSESAQKILDERNQAVTDYIDNEKTSFEERKSNWVSEIRSDSELGGKKFDQSVTAAKSVLDKFASKEFKKVLDETGLGNHPEVVRIFSRIGARISSDTLETSEDRVPPVKSAAEVLYG